MSCALKITESKAQVLSSMKLERFRNMHFVNAEESLICQGHLTSLYRCFKLKLLIVLLEFLIDMHVLSVPNMDVCKTSKFHRTENMGSSVE